MKRSIYQNEVGIILSTLSYGEKDIIAKTFTKELGLVSFFFKNALKQGRNFLLEPFSLGNFAYEEGNSSLLKLREFSCIEPHLSLRDSLESIESACLMAKALLKTQRPGLSAPSLFSLICLYLSWIPKSKDPFVLGASFLLKLLKYEGVFFYSGYCHSCGQEVVEGEAFEGTLRCLDCRSGLGCSLSKEEMHLFILLTESREFKDFKEEKLPEGLLSKIHHFFEASLHE